MQGGFGEAEKYTAHTNKIYLMKLYLLKRSCKTDYTLDTLIRKRLFKIHFSEQFIDYYLVLVILLEGSSHSLCQFFQSALLEGKLYFPYVLPCVLIKISTASH